MARAENMTPAAREQLAKDIAQTFAGHYYAKMGTGDIELLEQIVVRKLKQRRKK